MKFLLDSASLHEIDLFAPYVEGVTTNPSLLKNQDRTSFLKTVKNYNFSHVSFQVEGSTFEEQKKEALYYLEIYSNLIIKVPMSFEGLKTLKFLKTQKAFVNVTLIFSLNQAMLASSLGADFVSPFMGRLIDAHEDPVLLLTQLKRLLPSKTKILTASIRTLEQLNLALNLETDFVTLPSKLYHEIFSHSLTLKGLKNFNAFRPEKPLTELSF